MSVSTLKLGLVGPLPPPNGGMAMQTMQLARLLREEGVVVEIVQTNAPWSPRFIEKIKGLRALFRLLPYLWRVWGLCKRVDVIHLMSNSGWSWQLYSAPVLWVGWLQKTPVIVNYRGGEAREYLQKSSSRIKPSLSKATSIVVPSGFLERVFSDFDIHTQVIPNILDLSTFFPHKRVPTEGLYTLVVTRNLEPIYGLDTAIRCVAKLRENIPGITLKIAGSGPQLAELQNLVSELGLKGCVFFLGRLERSEIVSLYQSADVMLNPSLVDNMPNSILEALACGVPVVSTNVGGVPYLVEDGKTALLVEPQQSDEMALAVSRLYAEPSLNANLREAGVKMVVRFAWPVVKDEWLSLYQSQVMPA